VQRRLLRQAHSMSSPLYTRLLERCAADVAAGGPTAAILRGHGDDPPDSALGLRLMAAVHRMVLGGRAPALAPFYPSVGGRADAESASPALLALLDENTETIRELVARPLQTNEVGRSQALLCGFLVVAASTGLPLRLLEIGASAGLNLRWDLYQYEARGRRRGDPSSPVRLCSFDRVPVAFDVALTVASRTGCDHEPVDPTTEEGRLTLSSCIWADHVHRFRLLRLALRVARQVPVEIERAEAGSWLAGKLPEPVPGVATVVFHSIVMQYLEEGQRRRVEKAISAAGAAATKKAPVAWLRMEPEGAECAVILTQWPTGENRVVARSGFHGEGVRPGQ
jgi:hypothetical protein